MRSRQAVRRTVEVRDHLANPSAEWACLKLIQRQRWLLLRGHAALADDRRDIRAIRQARDRRKTRREGVHRSYSRKGVGRDEADGQPEQCDKRKHSFFIGASVGGCGSNMDSLSSFVTDAPRLECRARTKQEGQEVLLVDVAVVVWCFGEAFLWRLHSHPMICDCFTGHVEVHVSHFFDAPSWWSSPR